MSNKEQVIKFMVNDKKYFDNCCRASADVVATDIYSYLETKGYTQRW